MKDTLLLVTFFLAIMQNVFCQENATDKTQKSKKDAKSLELLKQLNSEDSDVLFKSSASSKLDSYLAEIGNKTSKEKTEFSFNSISLELAKNYSLIDKSVYKSYKSNGENVKKIQDLVEPKNNNYYTFIAINNGEYLLRIASLKPNGAVSVNIDNLDYTLNETATDENWGVTFYEWDKKPTSILNKPKLDSCGSIGSIVYKIDQAGAISPGIISAISSFEFKEKKYKSFSVNGLESISDGDYFFNENLNMVGVGYLIKGKSIIVDGLFISNIVSDLTKSLGIKSYVGVLGELVEKGFKVKEIVSPESKLLVNDIIEEVDNVKITKDSFYSAKQSFKKKKKVDIKIYRDNKQDVLKGVPVYHFSSTDLKTRSIVDYQKFYIWIDPQDKQQLTETNKFLKFCQEASIENFELKYYRLKEDSLINWLSTVKLIRFLLSNKKSDVFEWFVKNPFQDTDEYIIIFNQHFELKKGTVEELLANNAEDEKIVGDYTDGMLKYRISALPAISFTTGKGVSFNQDFESWISSLFDENGF